MKKFLILILLLPTLCFAQKRTLSKYAEIRVLTCGPYQGELYSAFGHSAIRVHDPMKGYDMVYNYGIFDFDQPNFYLNFARGYLNYKLAVQEYRNFKYAYVYYNRFIHEQILNLDQEQKQKLFDYLQWNAKPENQYYYYDYFYNNCATKVRDALKATFKDDLQFDGSYISTDYTIRDLTHIYLEQQPWGELGIDICLGLPMDSVATPEMYMFLPDYIEQGFNHASIMKNGRLEPLVKKTIVTNKAQPQEDQASTITPLIVFGLLLLAGIIISVIGYRKDKGYFLFDVILFSVIGLVGWLLLILWVATDHHAAARNFNLLWAIPLHFPLALFLLKKNIPDFLRIYFQASCLVNLVLLITWAFLPQNIHYSLIPLIILLLGRSYYIQRYLSFERDEDESV
ncbi:DUF4105 domain-containing protein [Fulvivirga maritima]|uniref:lipoprotein N-acyltransferase Lnb domain-containing protein n=1 Tax=Fulvivirga maritima TaxID=2904247 RepID=UPI001F4454B7|nr:DUF4105 domain-containing protein [Fulvivirga maritima]UII28661.1 DUF4105 domain-containing protein [Fulvivirga maritima]